MITIFALAAAIAAAIFNYMAMKAATMSADAADQTLQEYRREFNKSHVAIPYLRWTFVFPIDSPNRHIHLAFNFWNASPYTLEVMPYFRYKAYFRYDKKVLDSGFYKGRQLDSSTDIRGGIILDNVFYKGDPVNITLVIDTIISKGDSISLSKDSDMIFLEYPIQCYLA